MNAQGYDRIVARAEEEKDMERTLRLLTELERDGNLSQRDLSKGIGIALGLTNLYLKRLVRKGYIKVTTLPRNRLKYLLTPRGVWEKTRLTYEYIRYSNRFYRDARKSCREMFATFSDHGWRDIALYGTGEMGEIAYLTLHEVGLRLVAVVDVGSEGRPFFGYRAISLEELKNLHYDRLVVTSFTSRMMLEPRLIKAGISTEKASWLTVRN